MPSPSERRLVAVGIPEHRRMLLLAQAVSYFEMSLVVVPWLTVIHSSQTLCDILRPGDLLRIDSPGEHWETERALIARGAPELPGLAFSSTASRCTQSEALALSHDHGRLRLAFQWYRGFCSVLRSIDTAVQGISGVRMLQSPDDVCTLFDKRRARERMSCKSIPIPPGAHDICDIASLYAWMDATGNSRVFVKLASGSSAVGIVALDRTDGVSLAYTTMTAVGSLERLQIYNSLRVNCYRDLPTIERLIDWVLSEGAVVEQWMPRAGQGAHPCDLRVLVLGGKARHMVLRAGRSPMTNLHLGSRRGDLDAFRRTVPVRAWDAMVHTCERVAAAFPGNNHVGVDVLFSPDRLSSVVLEANAFGDLLPGIEHEGENVWTAQLRPLQPRVFG